MDLTFNQLEAALAERFDIAEDRAVAFRGRLQHLQRLSFPDDVNTGRGKKASYGWKQVIQLTVALDLIDLGLTPDVAIKSVRQGTDQLIDAVYRVTLEFDGPEAFAKSIKKGRCPFGKTQIAIASAAALSFPQGDEQRAYILTLAGPEFSRRLTEDPAFEPAAAYIDLGSRMMVVAQLVGQKASLKPTEVATDLIRWASQWAAEDTAS